MINPIEYGVYGDLIIIYPQHPTALFYLLKGTIGVLRLLGPSGLGLGSYGLRSNYESPRV